MARPSQLVKQIQSWLNSYGKKLVAQIKQNIVNKKKVASGKLLKSIDYNVKTNNQNQVSLELLSEPYLDYVDKGRRAGKQPPLAPILKWVKDKKIVGPKKNNHFQKPKQTAFAIARSIGKKGYPGSNVKTDAFTKVDNEFEAQLNEAVEEGVSLDVAENILEVVNQFRSKNLTVKVTKK